MAEATFPLLRAEARIDLDAIRGNVEQLRARSHTADLMAVVKADAYGHGLIPCARAAKEAGAAWLGTAMPEEAVALRQAGIEGRILTWLAVPGEPWTNALANDVDVSVNATWAVDEVVAAAAETGKTARLHLKADTGLSRAGATPADWPALVDAALKAQADGYVQVVGIWSHLAYADEPTHPTIARQLDVFKQAIAHAEAKGVEPEVRHLANSAATLMLPGTHFDLVRPGIAIYGVSPGGSVGSGRDHGLRPAMTLKARLAMTKQVPAGQGVSYGHQYVTQRETTLGLVPLGYADGIPRAATNVGPVLATGKWRTVAGRVCMDQFVIDLGDDAAEAGDEVVLFGPGDNGEPTADDWAAATGTIAYEIVTRIGPRVPRTYVGRRNP